MPIGFYIIYINNRRVELSFTYIISQYRNKGYSHELRIAAIEKFKDKYDKIETYILKNNIASLKGLEKLLEIYKYNQEESIKNEKLFLRSKKKTISFMMPAVT